jgi:hypothetical protein
VLDTGRDREGAVHDQRSEPMWVDFGHFRFARPEESLFPKRTFHTRRRGWARSFLRHAGLAQAVSVEGKDFRGKNRRGK